MLDSINETYTVNEVKDNLIDDNNLKLESFSLDESISTSLDLSPLFNSLKSFQSDGSFNQTEKKYLQNQFDFNSVTTNYLNFELEEDSSQTEKELLAPPNSTIQNLFVDNLNSASAFSTTGSSGTFNDTYDASLETAQTNSSVYLGYFQGTLGANQFTYTANGSENLAVISGNGNVDYGDGYYDSINFADISVNEVSDYSFAEIGSGGELFNTGDGDRIFDYITLNDGTKILFEGIDKIVFSDYEVDLTVDPNDTNYFDQWNLHMMGVQNAWRFTTGSEDVLVGVQDTGLRVDYNGNIHQDLRSTWFYNDGNGVNGNLSDDFYTEGTQESKTSSHGTAVQGIIAADTNNGMGIAGINWNSDVYNIDVLGGNAGDLSLQAATQEMIDLANSQGKRLIINMSLGTDSFGVNYHSDFEQLVANNQDNALFVIATGNSGHLGQSGLASPAVLAQDYDNVIAVGASWGNHDYYGNATEPGQRIQYNNWWGSQYGSGLTLMGPSEVLTTSGYHYSNFFSGFSYDDDFNGTSAATPNVSGVASLVWSANSNLSATQIKSILSETSYDLGLEGYDEEYGHGFVNADAAVRRAIALSYTDSLTGSSNSLSAFNTNAYGQSEGEIDPLTGNNNSNQFTLEEDFLSGTQEVADYHILELVSDTTINLGSVNSNEMMAVLQDSFLVNSGYDSPLMISNNLSEGDIFYNSIEI